jgi:hypothetical protein
MYLHVYNQLGNIGRFQLTGNTLRFIIGDIAGIKLIINLIHGKLRTPKNIRFNQLIEFLNYKYNLKIKESLLNKSNLYSNSWFTGFIEADGSFGIKTNKRKLTRNLAPSTLSRDIILNNISLVFRLDQRSHDISTNSSMRPIMQILADQLNCKLLTFKYIPNKEINEIREVYSVSLTSPIKLLSLIEYLNKYKDFIDWEKVYYMIISKTHLTDAGYLEIMKIKENMNSKRQFTNPLTLLSNWEK